MKNHSFRLFQESIKSEQTKKIYTYSLHEFMKFSKIKNYDDVTKLKTKLIQKLLQNWVIHLKNKQLRATTIRGKLCGIELFLEMNAIMFHKKILHKLVPSDDYVPGGDVPFTAEEIQKMLAATKKLRSKALIHFLASTGARPASITDPVLKLKHLEDMPNDCKAVKIYDGSKESYWAFLIPEATKALNHYLLSRKLNKEELTPESPVFANTSKITWTKKSDYMSAKSVRQLISYVLKAAGIERRKEGYRYDKAVVYGFRKRFNTILKLNNDVNSNIAEKLMAHKNGLDGSYLKPTKEECFKEFLKAIEQLTIDPSIRQQHQIEKFKQEKSDNKTIKKRLGELEQIMSDIASGRRIPAIPINVGDYDLDAEEESLSFFLKPQSEEEKKNLLEFLARGRISHGHVVR